MTPGNRNLEPSGERPQMHGAKAPEASETLQSSLDPPQRLWLQASWGERHGSSDLGEEATRIILPCKDGCGGACRERSVAWCMEIPP